MKLDGVYVAHTTPFDHEGKVDVKALKRHLEWLALAGVDGFVPAGTTGEGSVLDHEERKLVIGTALEVAKKNNLKVIAGCGGNHTEKVLGLLKEAQAMGCDAALVVTPYYNKPTQLGLFAHYQYLADRCELPIVLYNVPGRTAVSLSIETTLELLKHPRIVGIKEASGQYGHWLTLASEMNLTEKALLAGDDDTFAPILALGGSGIISASANVVPQLFVQLYKHAQQGEWVQAFTLQKKLVPLVKMLFAETSPAPVKWVLNQLGFGEATPRLPLVELTEPTARKLEQVLHSLELGR